MAAVVSKGWGRTQAGDLSAGGGEPAGRGSSPVPPTLPHPRAAAGLGNSAPQPLKRSIRGCRLGVVRPPSKGGAELSTRRALSGSAMGLSVKAELEIFMLEKGHRMPSIPRAREGCFPDCCSLREGFGATVSWLSTAPSQAHTGARVLLKGSSGLSEFSRLV